MTGEETVQGENGEKTAPQVAVFCVGNKLWLDDGLGPAVYEEVMDRYIPAQTVQLFDVGCMSMDMLPYVDSCDVIITVDAVDGTDSPAGTVFRYKPEDMKRPPQARSSLHDMRLGDLFMAASLLGYEAQGVCLGMQVENMSPAEMVVGLTPKVYDALPLLVETLAAELARLGVPFVDKETGQPVVGPKDEPGQPVVGPKDA